MEHEKYDNMQNQRILSGELPAAKARVQSLLSGPWNVDGTSDRLARAEQKAYFKNQFQSYQRGEGKFTGHYARVPRTQALSQSDYEYDDTDPEERHSERLLEYKQAFNSYENGDSASMFGARKPRFQALSESDYEHDDMDPEERHNERLRAYQEAFTNYENGESSTMFGARKPRFQALSESDYEHDDMDPEERHNERLREYQQAFTSYENGESPTMFGARSARGARLQKLSGLSTNANYEYDTPDPMERHNEVKGKYSSRLEQWYNGERSNVFAGVPRKQALVQEYVAIPVGEQILHEDPCRIACATMQQRCLHSDAGVGDGAEICHTQFTECMSHCA